jgi:hypothetical protein
MNEETIMSGAQPGTVRITRPTANALSGIESPAGSATPPERLSRCASGRLLNVNAKAD